MENIIGVLCILVGIARLAFGFKAQQDVHQSKKRHSYWKEHTFWTDGYFACSVGNVSEEMLKRYIENQG